MLGFLKNLFDFNAKELKRLERIVATINELEPAVKRLSDDELRAKTGEFSGRLANGETLDAILPEAFAVVREASSRVLGMRHFDVQLMGGIVLHEGKIAEMKTGEGKTLVATLPVYLNALAGNGVHVVTVNDYLAKRDSEWMGAIYRFLGMSVGCIVHGLTTEERRAAYDSDVTYGTNNEFGFDYLRDNMVIHESQRVQRELNYAIVDEVDSILIDEARTPLIISGQAEQSTGLYQKFAHLVPRLKADVDYTVDEKAKSVALTEEGISKMEKWLGVENLYDDSNIELTHHLNQALKAHALMKRDRDYVVKDNQVIIVDEFTGRLMFGRRYSDGLHQAIEAKEGVKVESESQTLATITFQNYFRMYKKLAGMTGTAATEAEEFRKIYGLDVVVIPTNMPMIRVDYPDLVFKTEKAKFNAVVEEIVERHKKGQPVLVGTVSIEKSEMLSEMLKRRGIPHQVLNAKYHEQEAQIVAKAGEKGMVTIATNMAGRGTDIKLGEGVKELGGLHIIGTERHEARRIDNQLRGRSGRQGDPGSSRFYVSLEDDLMRLFGGDRINAIMERLSWEEDQPLEHPWLAAAIERAQKRVEAHNFDIRKHVLEYDNVVNKQREVIYAQRAEILRGDNLKPRVIELIKGVIETAMSIYADEKVHPEEWDLAALADHVSRLFGLAVPLTAESFEGMDRQEIRQVLMDASMAAYEAKEREIGAEQLREIERRLMLHMIDSKWIDHLQVLDDLREGITLRAYGQENPLLAYQKESFAAFQDMVNNIREDFVKYLFRVKLVRPEEAAPERPRFTQISTNRDGSDGKPKVQQRVAKKVGRNDPCPCGSGLKYKKCCGRSA